MPGSEVLPPLGSVWVSGGLVGVVAWKGSGSRVNDGCWDTSQETVWPSWVEEACERRVWPH